MDAFFTRKRKKTYKGHHISEGIEIYRNSLFAVQISVCYSYCLVNLGHTLYNLYHLTFVVIVWLYAFRIMDLKASALGLVGKIILKQRIKNKVNCRK